MVKHLVKPLDKPKQQNQPAEPAQLPERDNPDKPGIGILGGYVPDNPGETERKKTKTIITQEPESIELEDVLDETDWDYMGEYVDLIEIGKEI